MAARPSRVWTRGAKAAKPGDEEARRIAGACETLVRDVLKPRFLPEITPTPFNYCVDIHGDWRAGRYRFLQRMRSGFADTRGEEFDHPFARLDFMGFGRFDIQWMRHTGSWWRLHTGLSLAGAIDLLETNPVLHPHA